MSGRVTNPFFSNTCRFGDCGVAFPTLRELIEHIEETHIDSDPRAVEILEEQQPMCIAMSYICRAHIDTTRRNTELMKKGNQGEVMLTTRSVHPSSCKVEKEPQNCVGLTSVVIPPDTPPSSLLCDTVSASKFGDEEDDHKKSDSDESWTMESTINSKTILKAVSMNFQEEKPYACPMPGCKKRYKNLNGMKYHAQNGHRMQTAAPKPFICHCGKEYKTCQRLIRHKNNVHPPVSPELVEKVQE